MTVPAGQPSPATVNGAWLAAGAGLLLLQLARRVRGRWDGSALDEAPAVPMALPHVAAAPPQRREQLAAFSRRAGEVLGRVQPPAAVSALLTRDAVDELRLRGAWLIASGETHSYTPLGPAEAPGPADVLLDRLRTETRALLILPKQRAARTTLGSLPAEDPDVALWFAAGARVVVPVFTEPDAGLGPVGTPKIGELVGLWVLGERRSGEPFDSEDLAPLRQIARRAAVLLDYGRLHQEYDLLMHQQELRQELTHQELLQARQVQDRLLPAVLPDWPGRLETAVRFRPARETSGDFYDVLPLGTDGRRLQIAVGDVSGKGFSAALVMALARTTLRALTGRLGATVGSGDEEDGYSPAMTLRLAGDSLHRDVGRGAGGSEFVACALAVAERGETEGDFGGGIRLRVANAAQVPPLLWRQGVVTEINAPGDRLPLGVAGGLQYGEADVSLGSGDVVVFASDGLPEAPGATAAAVTGELFGFARLSESVARWAERGGSADEIARGMWDDVAAWCGEASDHDDLTLLVLRVT